MIKFTHFNVHDLDVEDWRTLVDLMKFLHSPLQEIQCAMDMAIQIDRFQRDDKRRSFAFWQINYNSDDSVSFYRIIDTVTGVYEDDAFFEIQFV